MGCFERIDIDTYRRGRTHRGRDDFQEGSMSTTMPEEPEEMPEEEPETVPPDETEPNPDEPETMPMDVPEEEEEES